MNIVPKDQMGEGQEVTQSNANKNRKDYEITKKKRRQQKQQTENPMLLDMRDQFIEDITKLGFPKEDIELVLDKKGLYALDK